MSKIYTLEKFGLEVEIGKFAKQADGATWLKSGNTIVLSTAVAAEPPKEFMGFFPLTVEYRERMAAAGKFPGGFIKREGRLSDFEILSSRLIDRSIRPLFPEFYFSEVQVLSTVYSSDGNFPADILGLVGSSLALVISKIPFNDPVGAVRFSRIQGEWHVNASHDAIKSADAILTIAGTEGGICMVEGHCNQVPEEELINVLFRAHEIIKEQVAWQKSIAADLAKHAEVAEHHAHNIDRPHVTRKTHIGAIDWEGWKKKVYESLPADFVSLFYTPTKQMRAENIDMLRENLLIHFKEQIENHEIGKAELLYLFNVIVDEELPEAIITRGKRLDGRVLNEIRKITIETDILPRSHGSAVFTRGETQALVSTTLGTAQDAQKMEPLIGDLIEKRFMLHYNFTPFSTGEVKPIRGVGRREIGHGYLAESSFYNVLPAKEKFPYTIRVISDILESNGSSSMATVCGTTMALMDGGVPLSDMVGGIAMGLIRSRSGKFEVLSDILGIEDAIGLMDFKVTGTATGVTALQMDIKDKAGLTRDVLTKALEEARKGRLHILGKMREVMSAPRAEISSLAPRIVSLKVAPDKIGMIIGTAGKTIKEIIAQTGVLNIDIEDSGDVKIYSTNAAAAQAALSFIKGLTGDVEIGTEFTGKVKRLTDFGILVDVFPGKTGLVHISVIARNKQRDVEKLFPVDSSIKVKVVAYDKESGRISLVAPDLQ